MTTEIISKEHLDLTRVKITELGKAMEHLAQQNREVLHGAAEGVRTSFRGPLEEVMSGGAFKNAAQQVESFRRYDTYEKNFEKVARKLDHLFVQLEDTVKHAEKDFPVMAIMLGDLLSQVQQTLGEKPKKKDSLPVKLIKSEAMTVVNKVVGMANALKIPLPGHILGGLFEIMTYGYKRNAEIRAQTGEMKNILIAATDAGVKGAVNTATAHLGALQLKLDQFYGINRQEVQAVAAAFVDGGVDVRDADRKLDFSFQHLRTSSIVAALAIDKLFHLGSGTAAKEQVDLMGLYSKNIDDARESLTRMYLLGKESGQGAVQFAKNVQSAGEQVRMFGIDVDKVTDVMHWAEKAYNDISGKVPRQFSGRQAALGVQQISAGMAGLRMDFKMLLAEKMGYRRDVSGVQKMLDGFLEMQKKKNWNDYARMIANTFQIALDATGGDIDKARVYASDTMGLGYEGARLSSMMWKNIKAGNIVEAAKAAEKNIDTLNHTFGIAREKQSVYERNMNDWMLSVKDVGLSLIGMAANFLAMLVTYFRNLPLMFMDAYSHIPLLQNILTKSEKAQAQAVREQINKFKAAEGPHIEALKKSFLHMGGVLKNIGADVLSSSLNSLEIAMSDAPRGPGSSGGGGGGGFGGGGGGGGVAPSISIPMSQLRGGQTVSMSLPTAKTDAGAQGWSGGWAGGDVGITLQGVDVQGNIHLRISGNCPRCGFVFGGADDDSAYTVMSDADVRKKFRDKKALSQEAVARMLQSEQKLHKGDKGYDEEARRIFWTAKNRIAASGGKKDYYDVITGDEGFGYGQREKRPGEDKGKTLRPYSTRQEATPESSAEAASLLASPGADPTGGAQQFRHEAKGTKAENRPGGFKGKSPSTVMDVGGGQQLATFGGTGGDAGGGASTAAPPVVAAAPKPAAAPPKATTPAPAKPAAAKPAAAKPVGALASAAPAAQGEKKEDDRNALVKFWQDPDPLGLGKLFK